MNNFDADLDLIFQQNASQKPVPQLHPQTISVPVVQRNTRNRTIFVGNVNISVAKDRKLQKKLKALFAPHGKIESIRFRSFGFQKVPSRKAAFITGHFSPETASCNCYIVFEEEKSASEALVLNKTLFQDRHLRVDLASPHQKSATSQHPIFVGNLPFDVSEEEIWTLFASCGEIESVRVVRDPKTNTGKGICFVNFTQKPSLILAQKLNGCMLRDRKLRITPASK